MVSMMLICLLTATLAIGLGLKIHTVKRLHEIDGTQGIYLEDRNKLTYGGKP